MCFNNSDCRVYIFSIASVQAPTTFLLWTQITAARDEMLILAILHFEFIRHVMQHMQSLAQNTKPSSQVAD